MPRPENPLEAGKKARQARYRAALEAEGRPEASEVDVALAAAAAAFANEVDRLPSGMGDLRLALKAILRGAADLLVARGNDRQQVVAMIRWRVSKESRNDLADLVQKSRMRRQLGLPT